MPKRIHLSLDIRGALLNWVDSEWIGVVTDDDGRKLSPREAKARLLDELANGKKFLPIGECEGFDYQTGCPGHEIPDQSHDAAKED